jgi:hypothetical protein
MVRFGERDMEKIVLIDSENLKEVVDCYSDVLELINLTALGLLPFEIQGKHRYNELMM